MRKEVFGDNTPDRVWEEWKKEWNGKIYATKVIDIMMKFASCQQSQSIQGKEEWIKLESDFKMAVELLTKMVTDTNPEQVMETYEAITQFLNNRK